MIKHINFIRNILGNFFFFFLPEFDEFTFEKPQFYVEKLDIPSQQPLKETTVSLQNIY